MAAPTNTATTVSQSGNREDLSDKLERVEPEMTPFTSNIGAGSKATAVYHESQTESLATPSAANQVLEGDDTTSYAENVTTKTGNHTEINKKAFVISGTQEAVKKAGRKSEIARHRVTSTIEVKRDFESSCLSGNSSRAQSGATPRRLGGILSWIETNVSRGSGGANGGFSGTTTSAPTNGTQRAFTETLLKTVMQSLFNASGTTKERQLYMSAAHKQTFSGFTGISEHRTAVAGKNKMATIHGAAEAYMSDFGLLLAIPVAYGLTRDVIVIDPEYVGVSTLRPIQEEKLAKTGDNEKRHIICEKTLEVTNERALGVIADLS